MSKYPKKEHGRLVSLAMNAWARLRKSCNIQLSNSKTVYIPNVLQDMRVAVAKPGSPSLGKVAVILDPDWHGRVRVRIIETGEIKSYSQELLHGAMSRWGRRGRRWHHHHHHHYRCQRHHDHRRRRRRRHHDHHHHHHH